MPPSSPSSSFARQPQSANKYVEREILNQFKLRYPHVIALEEVRCMARLPSPHHSPPSHFCCCWSQIFLTEKYLVLVLEYASGGDLASHVFSLPHGMPEQRARLIFQQIMLAVDFCHRMGIVNRDIKLENILISENLVKLADFGFSKDETGHSAPTSRVGTIMYIAPEILTADGDSGYDAKKADMWSCGVVLFAMLTGRYPFHKWDDLPRGGKMADMNSAIKRILAGEYEMPTSITPECADLVRGLLTTDPEKRLSVGNVFEHSWFVVGMKPGVNGFNDRVIRELISNPPVNEDVIAQVRQLLAEAKIPMDGRSGGSGAGGWSSAGTSTATGSGAMQD